jgi:hypothetical protein
MSTISVYERILEALGEARRDAAEVGDSVLDMRLLDLQRIAIERLYTALEDATASQVSCH